MEYKMTSLGNAFSIEEKVVLQQSDPQVYRWDAGQVINFDQEKFEELLSQDSKSPLSMRKHRKIIITKAHVAYSLKTASVETK